MHGCLDWWARRLTVQRVLLSGNGHGRPPGRRQRALLSVSSLRSTGRSTGGSMIINMIVGRSTARSTGRAILPFLACNDQIYFGAIYTLFLELISPRFQERKFSHLLSVFSKSFWVQKIYSLFVFKGLENQEKEKSLGLIFDLHFYNYFRSFPKSFSL